MSELLTHLLTKLNYWAQDAGPKWLHKPTDRLLAVVE